MGGAIMEVDIHDWRAAHGAEGDFGCLEVEARLRATHKNACSAAWWHWDRETRETRGARQVRRYLGASERNPQRLLSESQKSHVAAHLEATEPPTRVVVTAVHAVRPPINVRTIHRTSQILTQSSLPNHCNGPAIPPR
jgi:hypothetical protein